MEGVVLGLDIQNTHVNIAVHHQEKFHSLNITETSLKNTLNLNFFPISSNIYNTDQEVLLNAKFMPYPLIWGVQEKNISPFFAHTFPQKLIFENDICMGFEHDGQSFLFDDLFYNFFKQLYKDIRQQFSTSAISISLHASPFIQPFLKKSFAQLIKKTFSCPVDFCSTQQAIDKINFIKPQKAKKQVHVFADYLRPYLLYQDTQQDILHTHDFSENIYRLDLAFLEQLKHQFIKSIANFKTDFAAKQRNQLFYISAHSRLELNKHPLLKAFIPGLCCSEEHGLHDFDTTLSQKDYKLFVQQNSNGILKEMDQFFLENKILPHDVQTLHLHGEGINVPGLDSVLAHYFQKPKETIVQDRNFISKACVYHTINTAK